MISGNEGLRIDRLAMNFGGVFVFEDVTIDIPPGKVTACIGPNGAGKTTIINLVCGVFQPKSGDIYVGGRKLTGVKPHDTVRHGVCRSFQDLLVAMPGQAGESLTGLFTSAARAQERANREKAHELLGAVALKGVADRPAGELPFGQQKLISLLRTVATEAKVLLLDEPAAGVENDLVPRVIDLIRGLVKAGGRATFLVEHNVDLVREVADQVCVLQGGHIIAAGAADKVLGDETVIREYLGRVYNA